MARKPSLEDSLDRLAQLRDAELGEAEVVELRKFLASPHSHAVAAAAELAGDRELEILRPELVDAFHRLMENPIKRDPGCRGKAAAAEALHQLDAYESELYIAGIEHRQMEPVWGGRQDTATELRIACGRGLVRMRHGDALLHLADQLADPEAPARIGAAQSIAYHGTESGLPILRLRVLAGDPDSQVVGECLLSMMRILPKSSLGFVADLLTSPDPTLAEAAALSLGETRPDGAFEILSGWRRDAVEQGLGDIALMAISMLRSDKALDYLLGLVETEPGPMAREVIEAFAIHRHSQGLMTRLKDAAEGNRANLGDAIQEMMGEQEPT
jgi:HEAT repeat protein